MILAVVEVKVQDQAIPEIRVSAEEMGDARLEVEEGISAVSVTTSGRVKEC